MDFADLIDCGKSRRFRCCNQTPPWFYFLLHYCIKPMDLSQFIALKVLAVSNEMQSVCCKPLRNLSQLGNALRKWVHDDHYNEKCQPACANRERACFDNWQTFCWNDKLHMLKVLSVVAQSGQGITALWHEALTLHITDPFCQTSPLFQFQQTTRGKINK